MTSCWCLARPVSGGKKPCASCTCFGRDSAGETRMQRGVKKREKSDTKDKESACLDLEIPPCHQARQDVEALHVPGLRISRGFHGTAWSRQSATWGVLGNFFCCGRPCHQSQALRPEVRLLRDFFGSLGTANPHLAETSCSNSRSHHHNRKSWSWS